MEGALGRFAPYRRLSPSQSCSLTLPLFSSLISPPLPCISSVVTLNGPRFHANESIDCGSFGTQYSLLLNSLFGEWAVTMRLLESSTKKKAGSTELKELLLSLFFEQQQARCALHTLQLGRIRGKVQPLRSS